MTQIGVSAIKRGNIQGQGALKKFPSKMRPGKAAGGFLQVKGPSCPFLSQSCPPDVDIPFGVGDIFIVPPARDPFLSVEEAGEDLASGPHSLKQKIVKQL